MKRIVLILGLFAVLIAHQAVAQSTATSTPTITPTSTPTSSPTITSTSTQTPTWTPTSTPTSSPTITQTRTFTPTLTFTPSATVKSTPSPEIGSHFTNIELDNYPVLLTAPDPNKKPNTCRFYFAAGVPRFVCEDNVQHTLSYSP